MNLAHAKEIAGGILKCGTSKIVIKEDGLQRVKESLTKEDLRALIAEGLVARKKTSWQSRSRARALAAQKKKGRKSGHGTRRGTWKSRAKPKENWMNRIRVQRELLKRLREEKKISAGAYRKAYRMAKGNYFRGKTHILQTIEKMGAK